MEQLNFKKLIKTIEAILKGHLNQERSNLQSTSQQIHETIIEDSKQDAFSTTRICKNKNFFYKIFNMAIDAKPYIDLTGRFPHQSSRRNNFILVAYNYDGNIILAELVKNRETDTIINA